MNIAIQGIPASFHDIAADKYFGERYNKIECESFRRLCEAVKIGDAQFGVMAIENTIAGSILANYKLIEEFDLHIVGEVYLPIRQYIMSKNLKHKDIVLVYSHYMALAQCENYLSKFPWSRAECSDTAGAARRLSKNMMPNGTAVIASKEAAELYGLELLEPESIEDNPDNTTRFLVLSKNGIKLDEPPNKATIAFDAINESMFINTMHRMHICNISASNVQSIVINSTRRYYIDISWYSDNDFIEFMRLGRFSPQGSGINLLGKYLNPKK